jgi:L-malate glycosyltransferase
MPSLAEALTSRTDLQLGILCFTPDAKRLFTIREDSRIFYVSPSTELLARIGVLLRPFPRVSASWRALVHTCSSYRTRDLDVCEGVIQDFSPDIVHVHGTEDFFGLLGTRTSLPVVVSIQGLLNECRRDYWGGTGARQRLMSPASWRPWLWLQHQARRERDIIRTNSHFIGRTLWDRSHLKELNPTAAYFECHEAIRKVFFETPWLAEHAERNIVYTTSSASPMKGVHTLIRAVRLLQEWGRPVRLRLAGHIVPKGWGKQLFSATKGMNPEPEWLGYLDEVSVRQELLRARVFVLPSFIENSSNSLAEAQVVGTPCVGSYVGGTPSMLGHGRTGLLFPKGDAAVLAETIGMILDDDALAQSLSNAARTLAVTRHQPETLAENVVQIYGDIIQRHRSLQQPDVASGWRP